MNDMQKAEINYDKCISCGACVFQCPFGAVVDNSSIVDAIKLLQQADHRGYYTVAIVAPAIASQFKGVKLGQVKQALRNLDSMMWSKRHWALIWSQRRNPRSWRKRAF